LLSRRLPFSLRKPAKSDAFAFQCCIALCWFELIFAHLIPVASSFRPAGADEVAGLPQSVVYFFMPLMSTVESAQLTARFVNKTLCSYESPKANITTPSAKRWE
jgi:hypothetical protein